MNNYNLILTEKQRKLSALSSGNIDKYEYLAGEKILPSDQRRLVEKAKFTYSSLGKALEKQKQKQLKSKGKQIKTLEEHEEKLYQLNLAMKRSLLTLLKQKHIFDELANERMGEIQI